MEEISKQKEEERIKAEIERRMAEKIRKEFLAK